MFDMFDINNYEKILFNNNITFNIQPDIINNDLCIKFSLLQDYNEIIICNVENLYYDNFIITDLYKNMFFNCNNELLKACYRYLIYKTLEYLFYNNKYIYIFTSDKINNEYGIDFLQLFGFKFIYDYYLIEI